MHIISGMYSGLQSSASTSSIHSYITKSARVARWDKDDVCCWLEDLGMEDLAHRFVKNNWNPSNEYNLGNAIVLSLSHVPVCHVHRIPFPCSPSSTC